MGVTCHSRGIRGGVDCYGHTYMTIAGRRAFTVFPLDTRRFTSECVGKRKSPSLRGGVLFGRDVQRVPSTEFSLA